MVLTITVVGLGIPALLLFVVVDDDALAIVLTATDCIDIEDSCIARRYPKYVPSVRGMEEKRNALPGVINDCCDVDELFSDGFDPDSNFCSSTIMLSLIFGSFDFKCQFQLLTPSLSRL
mmetsp:Transcript_31725/g.47563  ORF Transcript_31725/g.47563 Transcript_31725/m.47563 type:complete len:119 (-) Transcript_31725:40-396(-)